MADLVYEDRVQETTTTTGTGAITPNGAVAGSRSFAAVLSEGDQFYYAIDGAPADPSVFEVGIGTFTSGTIVRNPIVSSAGSGPASLPTGTKAIALTVAADFYATVQAHDVFAAWQAQPGNAGGTVEAFLDAMANVDGVVLNPPELVSNAFQQVVIDQLAIDDLPNSAGGNDAVNLRLVQNGSLWTQGPTGETNYYNTVFALGVNMTETFSALNTDMPSASYRIESKFAQGNATDPFMVEFHSSMFPATDPNNEYRVFSATIPHDPADWNGRGAGVYMRANSFRMASGMGHDRIQAKFGGEGNNVFYQDGGSGQGHPVQTFGTNNKRVTEQANAAGSGFLPLPFINDFDNIQLSRPAYIVGPVSSNPAGAVQATLSVIATGATANNAALFISSTPVSGNFFASSIQGSASANLLQQVFNAGAGISAMELQVLNGSGNDANIYFSNVGGGASFTIGYDNSDGDKLKIEKSYRGVGTGANLFVEFDPTINVAYFAKPPKLPGHTVANLPAAATVGAGAMAFCTNESGGSVPVFSDGTSWRRVTDRAVVS